MNDKKTRRRRRGVTITEAIVALAIVASAMVVGARTIASAAHQRRAAVQRSAAALEAANILQRAVAGDFETLAAPGETSRLSSDAEKLLPGAELKLLVGEPESGGDGALLEQRRVSVEVRWKDSAGEWAAPVRLSAWRHRVRSSPETTTEAEAAP